MTPALPTEHFVSLIERNLHWLPGPQPIFVRYGITTLLVILCFLMMKALEQVSGTDGFFVLYVPVFLGAVLFDRGSGFLASGMATALVAYTLLPEGISLLPRRFWIPVLLFFLLGLGIAALSEALRKGWERAVKAEGSKDVLYRELRHRTKNDFAMASSVLALQARSQESPEIKEALLSAAGRLTALSKAHERLEAGEAGPNAQMHDYLEALCHALSESNKPGNAVSLELTCSEIELPLSRAIPVGLITNELVTNAFRHAFEQGSTGSVMVRFQRGDEFELIVADDGQGCPDRPVHGVGSRLIEALVTQLEGRLERSNTDPGCHVRVSFPKRTIDPEYSRSAD